MLKASELQKPHDLNSRTVDSVHQHPCNPNTTTEHLFGADIQIQPDKTKLWTRPSLHQLCAYVYQSAWCSSWSAEYIISPDSANENRYVDLRATIWHLLKTYLHRRAQTYIYGILKKFVSESKFSNLHPSFPSLHGHLDQVGAKQNMATGWCGIPPSLSICATQQ